MLEAIREGSKGWLAKVILAAITIPFALFGIDQYLSGAGSNVAVAEVGNASITVQEYGNALQNLRNQLQAEGKNDPAMLDSPVVRQAVLDRLITNRLLNVEIAEEDFRISDEQLSEYIIAMPEFQQDGKFSQALYDEILAQNRLTPSEFESSMRRELLARQAREGFIALAYVPESLAERTLAIEQQKREVSVAEIKTADFISEVKVEPAEVQAYYEKHKDKFRVPEQVKLEYVMLSANNMIPKMQVTDEEAKQFYQTNAQQFQGNEQRRASHILIGFGVSATPEEKQAARQKAEEVLAQVRKNPNNFEELAKKYSQDPGSAEKGGDLGLFGRGMMVKPFEEAVFSMKPGEISDLVESEFGFHIIKLTEISGASQSFASAESNIRAELMYQKALSKFSEQAESFNNIVYEQSGSLQPAAEAFGMEIQTSDWLSQKEGAEFFKNDKLINMVFSDEVLKERRNTEAVEISPNTLLAARVTDYKPAAPRTFDEVKGGIESYLKLEKASKLAIEKGESSLAQLKKGETVEGVDWIPPVVVDRKNAQGLTDLAMSQAFKIDASKLPAYAGVIAGNKGYLMIKVTDVSNGLTEDEAARQAAESELRSALASAYSNAYIETLKQKTDININQKLISTTDSLQ
jgi:peptidyl-prolyl cis-trans isomerase D